MQSSSSVIVFASQKGGSGKTTLAGHIAVAALLAGAGPVAVIDTDPQRSLAQWRYAREDNSLILKVSDVENIAGDIDELRELGAAIIIIDTPPAATSAIGEVVRHADLVCIPTRPSPHDLRAVGATIDIVESHRRSMIFVLNSAAARAKITSEAALALSQHGTVAPTFIHNRVDFAASMTDGRTVMEVNEGSRSASEVMALWDYICQRLGKIHEWQEGGAEVVALPAASAPAAAPAQVAAPPQPEPSPNLMQSAPPEPTVEEPAPPPVAAMGEAEADGQKTPTAEEFFGQRRVVKTPTFFGPDRRRKDGTAPAGVERRAPAFGRRASS